MTGNFYCYYIIFSDKYIKLFLIFKCQSHFRDWYTLYNSMSVITQRTVTQNTGRSACYCWQPQHQSRVSKVNPLLNWYCLITETLTSRNWITSLLTIIITKPRIRFGCWNIKTMFEGARLATIYKEMQNFKLSFLGLSETLSEGSGCYSYLLIHSGTT